jgi:HAD superfamily hydrolase (TIGR01458 family)
VQKKEKVREWFGDLRGFLIDLDGVLYTGTTVVPGAKDALAMLEKKGYVYRFISNSTRRKQSSIADTLRRMGFTITPSEIMTPAVTAAQLMVRQGKKTCLLLSTGDVHLDFTERGIMTDDSHANTVVVADAGDDFTYRALNEAFRLLLYGGELLALEKDRFWMGNEGMMLSAGPYVAALEYASGKTARLIGKPSKEFFQMALGELQLEPGAVAMIGDDISSDILGAKTYLMRGILVKTGKYREEEVLRSSIRPDLIIDSIAALPEYLPEI